MAATMATTMALMNAKCLSTTTNSAKLPNLKPITPTKPISLLSIQNLPKGTLTSSALAGAIFATISASEPALAAQQIAQIAEGDNRGLALLLPIIPAIAWVLFNIFQPALNQINRMVNKSVIVGLGLGGLAASGFVSTPEASANEMAVLGEAAAKAGDSRGQLLLIVVAPAILWVLYNILQPALNQLNKMRSQD
ncbi:PREDICTED: photosystem II core complex proteins psbY, chloroplastic [Fragaria vesca subsp. vesca]|uniref:photosystem II core complex proteins psbY, chloroplastic n=1 Tax=Fragaria vesca subsp. vesca TaxID=101020 RepID=UPI0002C347FB|nr:PREDICTED: photosystem II core complex proteins psbY, chloroplastic [Fragaria vesca subsp. vesca]